MATLSTVSCTKVYSLPQRRFPWLLLALCAALVAVSSAHALARHGEQAARVERCANDADPSSLLQFYDPYLGRRLEFCPMPGGGYGMSVYDIDTGANITRYIPRWARSASDIIKKMASRECFAIGNLDGCWLPLERVTAP